MKKLYVKSVFCRIKETFSLKRIAKSVLSVGLFIGIFVFAAQPVMAEGSIDILSSTVKNYKELYSESSESDSEIYKKAARWNFFAFGHNNTRMTGGVSQQMKVKFYAYEGETVFIASSAVTTSKDIYITLPDGKGQYYDLPDTAKITNDNESKGPNKVYKATLSSDGVQIGNSDAATTDSYSAFEYVVPQSGVYIVEFFNSTTPGHTTGKYHTLSETIDTNQKAEDDHVAAFDITVCKNIGSKEEPHYNAESGRVWMDAIPMETHSQGVYGYLYTTTRDGYIWRFAFNGMQPYTMSIYANQRGGIGKGTNASAYHSVHEPQTNDNDFKVYSDLVDKNGNEDGIMIYGPDNETTDIDAPDHMFFNYPDKDLPKSIVAEVSDTLFSAESIQFDGRDPTIREVVGEDGNLEETTDNYGTVGVGGYFTVDTKGATSYRVIIDMSNMYARYYHGEEGSEKLGTDAHQASTDHNEEICLSMPFAEDNGEHVNFIYYDDGLKSNAEPGWYNIETVVKDKNELYDMHPVNNDRDMGNVVKYEKLEPNQLKDLGIDNSDPKGADIIGTNPNYKFKSLGKIMLGNAAVEGQTDRIYWNGRDQWGRILPVGQYFGNTGRGKVYAEAKAGEVHFPISDAEIIKNGLAVWLMNADNIVHAVRNGEAYNVNEVTGETAVRSNLYYNNEDKSLLRDYATKFNKHDSLNISWVWNLPSNMTNQEAGQSTNGHSGTSWLNGKWIDSAAIFENKSINGVASYSPTGSPTKNAAKFDDVASPKDNGLSASKEGNNYQNAGADHGILDVWTHVISPEKADLDTPITLYHFADRKIITGFVFLDTPEKGTETGKYNRMTNDHELEGAIIVAEYGDAKPEGESGTGGQRLVHYEAKTDTDGYYSIPVDLTAFDPKNLKTNENGIIVYPVKIWVYYNENISGAITHRVTTVEHGSESLYGTKQEYSEFYGENIQSDIVPSVSLQTVNIPKYITDKRGTTNVYLKEVYAGPVGYIAEAVDQALTITKKWEPSYLKSSTLEASFTIVGMKQERRTMIDEFFSKKANLDEDNRITVTEYDADKKVVLDVPYDEKSYIEKYGCKIDGTRSEESDENVYMAIQHDPNFPSDETVASIKQAVDTYNSAHPETPTSIQEVLVNGGEKVGLSGVSGYRNEIIYVVENATVEEARGGIYTNKILPKQTYTLSADKTSFAPEGSIVYRVYENPLGSSSSGDKKTTKTRYGIQRIGNEWTYTNILNLTNYTLTLFHDKDGNGKLSYTDAPDGEGAGNGYYDPEDTLDGDEIISSGANVRIAKMADGGESELGSFTHTLSDAALTERLNEKSLIDEYEEKNPGKNAKDSTTGEFDEAYKEWAEKKLDESDKDDGVQEIISSDKIFPLNEKGQITFEGLSSGDYSIYVTYETAPEYNAVTVDDALKGKEPECDITSNTYVQKINIGTDNNYYSTIGLGFRAEMPLESILKIYKNLEITGRPDGLTDKSVNLDDSFIAVASVKYTGTSPDPEVNVDDLAKIVDELGNDKAEMTVKVTEPSTDTQFDEEGKRIIFYAPGQYEITVEEKPGVRKYIQYDSEKYHSFIVEVSMMKLFIRLRLRYRWTRTAS